MRIHPLPRSLLLEFGPYQALIPQDPTLETVIFPAFLLSSPVVILVLIDAAFQSCTSSQASPKDSTPIQWEWRKPGSNCVRQRECGSTIHMGVSSYTSDAWHTSGLSPAWGSHHASAFGPRTGFQRGCGRNTIRQSYGFKAVHQAGLQKW